MKKHYLGNTGIEVSEICFGSLTLGPLQKNLELDEGFKILKKAYDKGINFFDTADMYDTYEYLRELVMIDPNIVICSRSYDYTREGLEKSLNRALNELNRDYIDLFLLHEQESKYTFEGHKEAIDALIKAKQDGKVKAIGFSTHRVEAVRDAINYKELEVIFALINKDGLGIEDGSRDDMISALIDAKKHGKAIFAMKPLGGGNLIKDRKACLDFQKELLNQGIVDSIAIGMGDISEVEFNTKYFANETISKELSEKTLDLPRELHIDDWCERCGNCVKKCHQQALRLENNKIEIDKKKCLTCGYCASVCPVFAIKVV